MFNPSIQVIVAQPNILTPPDLSFPGISQRFPGLAEAEAVCLTGSTASGWGNTFSDIDLYVFADRELDLPVDETMERWPGSDPSGISWENWMGAYGDSRVDLTIWTSDVLATVLAPYLDNEVELCPMSLRLQDVVYRVTRGLPLKNEEFFKSMRDLLNRTSYQRSLARLLKTDAENLLTDVMGQLNAGDDMSARVSAGMAAMYATDACLVLFGELCRRQKWVLRRLQNAPQCGITVEAYKSVVLSGPRPGESDGHAAARIARWAQAQIVRLENDFLSGAA